MNLFGSRLYTRAKSQFVHILEIPSEDKKAEAQLGIELAVSTVTPVYSGEKYLAELIKQISDVRDHWQAHNYPMRIVESIFVVDSAIDGSLATLQALAVDKPWIKVIELAKNFGQHPATVCGVLYSSGDWIITLDEDLQHHPTHFTDLFRPIANGPVDIVYAKPTHNVHESMLRDWGSRGFKKLVARITNNPFVVDFNSFRLMRGSIARAAASVCSHETYFDVAICWFTNKISTLNFKMQDQRFIGSGQSGYGFFKLLSHARRLIISSQTKLLRVGAWIGFFSILLAAGLGAYHFYLKLYWPEEIAVRGWTSLFLAILFMGGLSSLLLSIVIEYLGNILLQTQGKPVFFTVDRSSDKVLQEFYNKSFSHGPKSS